MSYADQLARAVGYDDESDGSVDVLVAYKNVLEDVVEGLEEALDSRDILIEDRLAQGGRPADRP